MALAQRPKRKPDPAAIDAVIGRAPDVRSAPPPAAEPVESKENKKQISITVDPSLLALVDATAKGMHMSRASAFSQALAMWCEKFGKA